MNKRIYFSVADNNNLKLFEMLKNSFHKFHPKDELRLYGEEAVKATGDPNFYWRRTPFIANELFKEGYTEVCALDCDQIITGNLDHIWEGDFDVAAPNNSNPREMKTYPVAVLDIHPLAYVNGGMVVMKSQPFITHWMGLCYSEHFPTYQMKEQDFLNILFFYASTHFGGPYKIKLLDHGSKWHGLIAKQYTPQMILKTREIKLDDAKVGEETILVLPKNEEWNKEEDKEIVAFHFAGGQNDPRKGNYKLIFPPEVVKWIDKLVKP